ncbi:MAG: glycosyl transferase [Leptospira sp.]|nr:MAG: glycosyl transferase [Leptospira sp.]
MRAEQKELFDEIYNQYAKGSPKLSRFRLMVRMQLKNLLWKFVISATYAFKRTIDILASGILMIAFSPIFLVVAILIKLESSGNIFFHQNRIGKWGKIFRMHKFRSMRADAETLKEKLMEQNETGGVIFKMKEDPRVTKVGRFIRKFSIDELPQLWNVFVGEMSLVGPRPPVPKEVAEYSQADRRRLEVTPGITCIWQVSGRSEINFEGQVKLDVQYIYSQSIWQDILILLRTIPAVLFGKGAY